MWANVQRDARPAEHRWRPLFNATKFGWRPLLDCRAVMLPRRDTGWNMMACPKPANRSQPFVSRSSPYCKDIWRRYCCLTSFFFWLSIHALVAKMYPSGRGPAYSGPIRWGLSCKDIAWQICAMVLRWWFFASFLHPVFPASRLQHISDLHSKFALRPHHVSKYGRHPVCGHWE